MPVVPFKGDHSHHATATSDDDADYEEDDEITGIVQPRPNFGSVEQKNRNMLVNRQEFDREDVEMMMDLVEKAEEFAPDLLKKEDERSSYSHRKVENRKKLGRMKKHSRYAQLDRRNTASGSDEDMESIASIGENEDDESKESSDSDPEEQWASEPEDDDEIVNPNCCIYCHQDEENDPSEEFELYLSCGVCGDNAHRQCARDADALKSGDEGTSWYCSECVSNDLVRNASFPESSNKSPRKVVSRNNIAFNLLKSQRDKTTNNSRFLRKRKNSPCTDTISEDLKMPRRRARHQERGLSCVKNLAPDRDGLAGRQIELDTAESHSGHHTSNDHSQRLETNAEAFILRSIRPKLSSQPRAYATISEKSTNSLKILIKVDPLEIRNRLSNPPKPKEKSQLSVGRIPVARLSTFAPLSYPHPFYLSHDREADELKSKPYGGILTEKEADTSLTLPKPEHRRQFDEARQKAEEDWKARAAAAAQAAAASGIKKPRKVSGPASQIEYIEFGDFQIDIWYAAPYPEEYSRNKALFICEYCLKYMESDIVAWRHTTKCPWKNPPGDEIYRDGQVAVFEVDGRKNPLYCQNLCLLAKLFLGSKTLYYDVEPFLFYVMTEYDKYGCHFVGYFSKEKRSSSLNNVSCILVLPIHQRKGYGHLLIDFSYLLTRVEKKTGSPEKPLSDMGLVSYRNYWRLVLCKYLKDFRPGEKIPSIRKISSDMGLSPDDVISALDALGALVRDPITGTYAIKIRPDYFQQVIQNHESKNYVKLNPDALFWTPYVIGRWNTSNIDYTPTLETITQPEEEQPQTSNITPSPGNKRDFRSFSEPQIGPNSFSGVIETPYLSQFTAEICTDSRPKIEKTTSKLSYYEAAALIPPTRFEVFPPPSGSRTRAAARNPSARQSSFPSPGSRLTPRRFEGSSRSTPCSKPQGKSGQRVSEGSGRGSGRWPREITKADGDLKEDQLSAAQRSRCEGHSGRDMITTERGGKGEGVGSMGQSDQGALGKRDVRVAAVMLDSSGGPQRRDRHVGQRSALGKPCLEGSGLIAGKGTAPTLASASGLPPLPRSGADADVEMPDMSAAPSDADQVMKMDVDVVDRIFN